MTSKCEKAILYDELKNGLSQSVQVEYFCSFLPSWGETTVDCTKSVGPRLNTCYVAETGKLAIKLASH